MAMSGMVATISGMVVASIRFPIRRDSAQTTRISRQVQNIFEYIKGAISQDISSPVF